jgi:threonine dehydrogenase-like Zn-dependent dehydrogenase
MTGAGRPFRFGHEFSGTVAKIGPNCSRTDVKVGDRVAVEPLLSCGECQECKDGKYNLCPTSCFVGYHWPQGGGLGEQVAIPEAKAFVLPDNVTCGSPETRRCVVDQTFQWKKQPWSSR